MKNIKVEKITARQADLLLRALSQYENAVLWLIASWEKGLTKAEKDLALDKYEKLRKIEAQKRLETYEKWKKNL